ncbi:MAG: zinc ribbon domain-containing protein [Opitutus sp.]|nr:zinc ribbon domain-containing protein [Opitutus sp.]MCS6247209.1 zinc ribbon domain-containing protein [Opitutus sp.]MCS6273967.1 zinc ribbon domain-containing protein [Opitutus sp.]MCS6278653.1 zinc ribbon domain-containing protein [Opitutus sp.]MCS6298524.1 zinc ribbon domain-containing protein [Opitutus sp.]
MAAAQRPLPPEDCAQCGEPIPRNAHACPSCGADERTGWRETSIYDGLDLPDEDDEPASENKSGTNRNRRHPNNAAGLRWYWFATLIAVLLVLGLGALGLRP